MSLPILNNRPIADPNRTEFGQPRTKCGCHHCQTNCAFMPGYLIPTDLKRLIPEGVDPLQWAESNLLASPGATVAKRTPTGGIGATLRIPTLVVAEKQDHSCIHLTSEGHCGIHDNAPFGCAFFDCRSTGELSKKGLMAIAEDWGLNPNSLYRRIWEHLAGKSMVSDPADVKRNRMMTAMFR